MSFTQNKHEKHSGYGHSRVAIQILKIQHRPTQHGKYHMSSARRVSSASSVRDCIAVFNRRKNWTPYFIDDEQLQIPDALGRLNCVPTKTAAQPVAAVTPISLQHSRLSAAKSL
jgi:hypothetical protein